MAKCSKNYGTGIVLESLTAVYYATKHPKEKYKTQQRKAKKRKTLRK